MISYVDTDQQELYKKYGAMSILTQIIMHVNTDSIENIMKWFKINPVTLRERGVPIPEELRAHLTEK